MKSDLQLMRARVRGAGSEDSDRVFESVLDELEDALLSEERFSEGHFDALCEVLQDESLFSKPGAWRVPMSIYHDRDKLTEQQTADLFAAIVENYHRYQDEELCLTAADLIARAYPVDAAIEGLRQMASVEHQPCLSAVKVALNALACRLNAKDSRLEEVKRLYLET